MAKILIVGCGSIGMKLAQMLSDKGHEVTGLKRNPPKAGSGNITYFTADISSTDQLNDLAVDFEVVYFIVSPDGRNKESYQAVYKNGLNNLLNRFSKEAVNPRWIFVSSTSVYGQSQGEWVDEDSIAEPENITSQIIKQAEQQLIGLNPDNIVVRFSGIYGPGREYLLRMAKQGSEVQKDPPYYTNRIHQQDCIGVLVFLLEQSLQGIALEQCYVASDDDPATMWEVMSWLAEQMNCQSPLIKTNNNEIVMNKRCHNQRLKKLGYHFQYPDFKTGYLELIH
jgi:nucleoside-diphosphate-sugar epimerase